MPFLYVPDFPDLPMEEVYPREAPRGAAVVAREHAGGGRTVYIPWNIGAIFWEVLAADHARLIANAVRWALGKRPRVEVEGTGVLDIAVRESDEGLAVVLSQPHQPDDDEGPDPRGLSGRPAGRFGGDPRRAGVRAARGCWSPGRKAGARSGTAGSRSRCRAST